MSSKAMLLDDATARRFGALPVGVPGHLTKDEVLRAVTVHQAAAARSLAEVYALALVERVFGEHLDATSGGEALRLAGLEEEYWQRVAAIPPPDEVGMRWLIDQVERSLAEGTFIAVPPQA